ncbi:hypothetical protein CDL60_24870 [Roseateles noduli]|nr:hypothetical protein CDL60_24870 [Roseateles noduli]
MTTLAAPLGAHPVLSSIPTDPARLDVDAQKDAAPSSAALKDRAPQQVLARHQVIERRSTTDDARRPEPAPFPNKPKISPATLLRGTFSRVIRAAKSTVGGLVHPTRSATPISGVRPAPQAAPSRSELRAARKDAVQHERQVRAGLMRKRLMDASEALDHLELSVTKMGASADTDDRTWALTARNVALRQARATLDSACSGFKPDANGLRKADAALRRVIETMASI